MHTCMEMIRYGDNIPDSNHEGNTGEDLRQAQASCDCMMMWYRLAWHRVKWSSESDGNEEARR